MKQGDVQPNGVTCFRLLTLCSHLGLVDRGHKYFEIMSVEHGVKSEHQPAYLYAQHSGWQLGEHTKGGSFMLKLCFLDLVVDVETCIWIVIWTVMIPG